MQASHCGGFSRRAQALGVGSVLVAHRLLAPWLMGSSWTRDQTDVHATAGRFLSSVPLEKSHLTLNNLRSRYPNPHFTGEETEASVIE